MCNYGQDRRQLSGIKDMTLLIQHRLLIASKNSLHVNTWESRSSRLLLSKKNKDVEKVPQKNRNAHKQALTLARSWRPGTILCGFLDDTI